MPLLTLPRTEIRKRLEALDFRTLIKPLSTVEKDAIISAMILCEGDITGAARRLKIGRATLYRKLSKYRMEDDGN